MKSSRTIAYVSLTSAIAVVFAMLSAFLPSKVVPLAVCALCYLIAYEKTRVWGFSVCIIVSNLLIFAFTGFSTTLIINLIVFTPYSIIAVLLKRLSYKTKKTAIIRIFVVFAFFSLVFFALISMGTVIIQFPYENVYWALGVLLPSVLIGLFCVPADYFITTFALYVCSKIM